MKNAGQLIVENETEISISDIIHFFVKFHKHLIIGAIIGCLATVSATLLFGKYEGVATLINNKTHVDLNNNKTYTDPVGIDYLMLNRIRKELPMLADKLVQQDKNNADSYLNQLSTELWWGKNIKPIFSLTKEDSRELFGVPKDLQDAEATKLKGINVKVTGISKEQTLANLSTATSFIRNGAAYLDLKDLIAGYQITLLNAESEIAKDILNLEIESKYLNTRLANLEALKVKFPGSQNTINNQVMDFKDSSAKFLPLSTQLVAANLDSNTLKEQLSRLHDKKQQNAILGLFLAQAVPVIERNFNGLSAVTEIAQIESSIRKEIKPTDLNARAILDRIKYNLTLIATRYQVGLEPPSYIDTSKPNYLKYGAIGLFAGFFLALLISLLTAIKLHSKKTYVAG